MGIHEWSYDNEVSERCAQQGADGPLESALTDIKLELELGFDPPPVRRGERCLNCDVQTVFTDAKLCIECDACVDICPMDCITFTANGEEEDLRTPSEGAGEERRAGACTCPAEPQDRSRHGQGRKRLPALRHVRRTLPDGRVGHAEVFLKSPTPAPEVGRDEQPAAAA